MIDLDNPGVAEMHSKSYSLPRRSLFLTGKGGDG